ncbi:hypothetical protein CEXT_480001 [Caerostris extrusa]|uniref:Uncharacterized protein n=1 Tax=Caerostris extrusa TaxID=172846 RepID=A0AAV4RRB5_CAEEX|nr:hypothetical protein CEXT_480001 [Caerostris extrusa]
MSSSDTQWKIRSSDAFLARKVPRARAKDQATICGTLRDVDGCAGDVKASTNVLRGGKFSSGFCATKSRFVWIPAYLDLTYGRLGAGVSAQRAQELIKETKNRWATKLLVTCRHRMEGKVEEDVLEDPLETKAIC